MSPPRVLVTGIGVVSALAIGRGEHLRRLLLGEASAAATPPSAIYHQACPLEARVGGFDRRQQIRTRMLRKLLTTSAAFAVAAAAEALADAGIAPQAPELASCGLYAGSVCIDFDPEIFIPALRESLDPAGRLDAERFARRGLFVLDPLFLVKTLPNGGVGGIAIEHQVTGPSLNITNGTASGLQALLAACRAIRTGATELALAGGYDSLLSMDSVAEHLLGGRVAVDASLPGLACRPFDLRRQGYVLSEGSAFLLLESAAHAARRSARAYGQILGGGQSTAVAAAGAGAGGGGLVDAARCALEQAECPPAEVGAVFGDGLAVEADELLEAAAVRQLFGARQPAYTAATASLGFTGAASGTFSLAHALESLRGGVLPPMINCGQPDPRCGLDFVHRPRQLALRRALVWSSDRGAKNAAVVVGTCA
jgi:3-oxoacyl-(acyl-carrier-protein) synthase